MTDWPYGVTAAPVVVVQRVIWFAFGEIPLRIYVLLIARAPRSSATVNCNE